MKNRLWVLGILFVFFSFFQSCDVETPEIPTPIIPPIVYKANIVLDGNLSRTMTSYGCPKFEGYVKNIGNGTGYNCMVSITCYSDSNKKTIIDTASGFPANLGDIKPDQRAYFDAVAFNCTSHDQIKSYDVKITWLDRA